MKKQLSKLSKLFTKQRRNIGDEILNKGNPENVFTIKNLNLWYDNKTKQGLKNISLDIQKNKVTALIGASGCGKSTLLRCLNRMNDSVEGLEIEGSIYLHEKNIYSNKFLVEALRMQVGMVFQKPTPFGISVKENILYGLKANGIRNNEYMKTMVEKSLKRVALWEEVKDNLDKLGTSLSGGQQQRLCIARTIALEPEILLMDEPTSALDPIAVSKIEELIIELSKRYTIVLVSHSMSQVQRVSDFTVYMDKGEIIEADTTRQIFTNPKKKKTRDYISGDF